MAGIAAIGVAIRAEAALVRAASPDAVGFAARASDFSFLHPWAAGDREPLWVAISKVVSAPFGYSTGALQALSLACSIVAMVAAWRLLRRVAPGWPAVVGFALVALHPLLVIDAANGVREPAALAICAVTGSAVLAGRWAAAGVWVGVLAGVRWELAVLWVGLLAVAVVARRLDWRSLAAAGGVAVVLMGPFMAANAAEFGDPMHHSNRHAVYYRNLEEALRSGIYPYELDRFRGEPITWGEYYTDFVGMDEAVGRAADGVSIVPARVLRLSGVVNEKVAGFVVILAALAVVALRRTLAAAGAALLLAGGVAGYAALWGMIEMRLVSFLVLPLAVLAAEALAALLVTMAPPTPPSLRGRQCLPTP